MTTTPSRRGLLAGAAASIPATALAALPAIATPLTPDPIFAAIKTHKAAWHAWMVATDRDVSANSEDPEILAAREEADYAHVEAAWALLETMPTSNAGMVALMLYVVRFTEGALTFQDPDGVSGPQKSKSWMWPEFEEDKWGLPEGMSFTMAVIRQCVDYLAGFPRSFTLTMVDAEDAS